MSRTHYKRRFAQRSAARTLRYPWAALIGGTVTTAQTPEPSCAVAHGRIKRTPERCSHDRRMARSEIFSVAPTVFEFGRTFLLVGVSFLMPAATTAFRSAQLQGVTSPPRTLHERKGKAKHFNARCYESDDVHVAKGRSVPVRDTTFSVDVGLGAARSS
ncbi:hypothetical protein DFJ74DRAFT_264859 [Hyaloraphidium curvatum]|nr:hypothetical protein DFJ74DRAFT_264859 [Hyaloraphidium curvatum]